MGANVNVRNKITQETPLHVAAYRGAAVVTEMLLERGGDPMALDKGGVTPLDVASRQNHKEVVALLLKHGGKAVVQNSQQETPCTSRPAASTSPQPAPC